MRLRLPFVSLNVSDSMVFFHLDITLFYLFKFFIVFTLSFKPMFLFCTMKQWREISQVPGAFVPRGHRPPPVGPVFQVHRGEPVPLARIRRREGLRQETRRPGTWRLEAGPGPGLIS